MMLIKRNNKLTKEEKKIYKNLTKKQKSFHPLLRTISVAFKNTKFLYLILSIDVLYNILVGICDLIVKNENFFSDSFKTAYYIVHFSLTGIMLIFFILNFIVSINNIRIENDIFYVDESKNINKLLEENQIKLSDAYIDSNYEIIHSKNDYVIMSNEINNYIFNDFSKINLKLLKNKQYLTQNQGSILKKRYEEKKENNTPFFNGKHIGLRQDLLKEVFKKNNSTLEIQKTDYFCHVVTNQLIYKSYINREGETIISGKRLTFDDNLILRHFSHSSSANMLGVSSILITNDGKLVIAKQSKYNDESKNAIIPSASGSIDFDDYKNIYKQYKSKSLDKVVKYAALRELKEELYLYHNEFEMISKTIGFGRLIKIGGHPEFFVMTYINQNYETIKSNFNTISNNLDFENSPKLNNFQKMKLKKCKTFGELNKIYDIDINELSKYNKYINDFNVFQDKIIKELIYDKCTNNIETPVTMQIIILLYLLIKNDCCSIERIKSVLNIK